MTQPLNVGETDYDALMLQLDKRFSNNYSARVSYTLAHSRGNTSGNGVAASGFQVLDDMHLELNEGPTAFDQRHNFVVSGTALVPHTGGLNFSWVARALSGTPVQPDQRQHRSRSQRDASPSRCRRATTRAPATDALHGEGLQGAAQRRLRPRLLPARPAGRLPLPASHRAGAVDAFVDFFNVTDRVNFANPTGNQASPTFLVLTAYSTSYTPRKMQLGVRFEF